MLFINSAKKHIQYTMCTYTVRLAHVTILGILNYMIETTSPTLRISLSGIRGIIGTDITSDRVYHLAYYYAKKRGITQIAIGRDARPNSNDLYQALIDGLIDAGCIIHNCNYVPLPSLQIYLKEHADIDGGIHLTASHNPPEYNGLKMMMDDGVLIDKASALDLFAADTIEYIQDTDRRDHYENNIHDTEKKAIDLHINKVAPLTHEGRHLTIAVDALNSVGSNTVPEYFKQVNVTLVPIATNLGEPFPHMPEPKPENLAWTQNELKKLETPYDFCAVIDPDADRLVLIDGDSNLLSEEFTLPLIARAYRESYTGDNTSIVVNYSTSMASEIILEGSPISVERSAVGERNVIEKMKQVHALWGGEGSGGVIDPRIIYGRDALTGLMHIINLLRSSDMSLADHVATLPQLYRHKSSVPIDGIDFADIKKRFIGHFTGRGIINTDDGFHIRLDEKEENLESWIHVRPSNTEPILRIYGESTDELRLNELIKNLPLD